MIKAGAIRKEFRRLRLKEGDVMVVNLKRPINNTHIEGLMRVLKGVNRTTKASILVVAEHRRVSVDKVDEATMNRLGWYRKPVEPGCTEGETCNRDGCQGTMELEEAKGCTCFQSAPCSACMGRNIVCNDCGETAPNGD